MLLAGEAPDQIVSVKAAPLPLLPTSRFGTRQFNGDFDPGRFRWFGPFSQLAGSILVQIRTREGLTGYGMGGGGTAAIHIIDNHLKDLLVGANPSNVQLLWDQMFSSTSFYGRRGVPIMAISGIDLALWDVLGKRTGQPVWQLLGGAARERVPAYYTGGDIQRASALGFSAMKLGLSGNPSPESILAQLQEARQVIGPAGKLMVDVLCRWDVERSLDFCRRAEAVGLYFLEEPLLPDDVVGYARLCREVRGTRIACGEHEFTRFGFAELVRSRAAHILQPDLTWGGGLTEGRRILAVANHAGLPLIPHRGGSLFGIHLLIAHQEIPMAESFGTAEDGNELMALLTAPFQEGHYLRPERPGLGFDLPPTVLKQHCPSLAN